MAARCFVDHVGLGQCPASGKSASNRCKRAYGIDFNRVIQCAEALIGTYLALRPSSRAGLPLTLRAEASSCPNAFGGGSSPLHRRRGRAEAPVDFSRMRQQGETQP